MLTCPDATLWGIYSPSLIMKGSASRYHLLRKIEYSLKDAVRVSIWLETFAILDQQQSHILACSAYLLMSQADFSFFFDTGGRRRCYIAPERLFTSDTPEADAFSEAPLLPSMVCTWLGFIRIIRYFVKLASGNIWTGHWPARKLALCELISPEDHTNQEAQIAIIRANSHFLHLVYCVYSMH